MERRRAGEGKVTLEDILEGILRKIGEARLSHAEIKPVRTRINKVCPVSSSSTSELWPVMYCTRGAFPGDSSQEGEL